MIDFTKIKINGCNIQRLMNYPLLEFKRNVSEKTGLLDTKSIAIYHHCKIVVYDSGTVIFSGSLHKMYNSITGIKAPKPNGNGYNGNQFYWHEIEFALENLIGLFVVSPEQMQIQQIEYGVNLITPFNPQDFISGLLMHRGKPFEFRYNEYYAQAVHDEYILKIYNKGNQYQTSLNTLRIEIKVRKMRYQKSDVGIQTVADIALERLTEAFKLLARHLQYIIYFDNTIEKKPLSKVDKNRLQKLGNPNYWKKLATNKRDTPKKLLANLIEQNSANLKGELLMLIEKNRVRFHQESKEHSRVRFHYSNIEGIFTPNSSKTCPITGIDITMQKEGSNLLSNTGLKYLEKTDKKKFGQLAQTLLTGRHNEFEKTVYDKISKQIRNRYYNRYQEHRPEQTKLPLF